MLAILVLVTLPSFMAMTMWRTPMTLLCASALMATMLSLGVPAILVAISESLPPHMRSGGIGLLYKQRASISGAAKASASLKACARSPSRATKTSAAARFSPAALSARASSATTKAS